MCDVSSNNQAGGGIVQNAFSAPLQLQVSSSVVSSIENIKKAATKVDIEMFDEDGDIVMDHDSTVHKQSSSVLQDYPSPNIIINTKTNTDTNNLISTLNNLTTPHVQAVVQERNSASNIPEINQNNGHLISSDSTLKLCQDLIKEKNPTKSSSINGAGDNNHINSNVLVKIKKEFPDHDKSKNENNCLTQIETNVKSSLLKIDDTKEVPIVIKKEFKDITYLHTLSAIAEVNKYSSYPERGRGSDYRRRLDIADSNREEMNVRKRQQKEKQMRKDEKSLQHNLRQAKIKADAREREKARDLYGLERERTEIDTVENGIPYVGDYAPMLEYREGNLNYQDPYSAPTFPLSHDSSYKYPYNPQPPITPYTSQIRLPMAPLLSLPMYQIGRAHV